jgi:hypothetical protein
MEKINALKRALMLWSVLLLAVPMTLHAQTVELGITENPSDQLEVRFKPSASFNGLASGSSFTIRWTDIPSVSFGTPVFVDATVAEYMTGSPSLTFPGGGISTTTNGGYKYTNFTTFSVTALSDVGASWSANTEVAIIRIPVINPTNACVTFEVLNDSYTTANNLEWYVALNGFDSQNGFITGKTSSTFDDQLPTISCPANVTTATSLGTCARVVTGLTPTTADNCGTPALTYAMTGATTGTGSGSVSGFSFNQGITTVTYTVTDPSLNTASCSFTVTIVDNESPTVACPADQVVSTDPGICTATLTSAIQPTVSDNCSPTFPTSYTLSGATTGSVNVPYPFTHSITFNKGVTTVLYNIQDLNGNNTVCSFTVTVNDTQVPVLSCPANVIVGTAAPACTASVAAASLAVGVNENCTYTLSWSLSGATPGSGTGQMPTTTFDLGVTTLTYTINDGMNAPVSCSSTVTVNDDDAPTVNNTAGSLDQTLQCSNAAGITAALALAPTAADNCTAVPTLNLVSDNTVNSMTCANAYVRTRIWNFTDAASNTSASFTQVITVIDNTAPTVTAGTIAACYPTQIAAEAAAIAATTATDNCTTLSGANYFASTSGTCSAVITVTVNDGCGNSNAVTYNTRIDNTGPTLAPGSIAAIYADVASAEAAAIAATGATDNCPGTLTKTATTTGTCTATVTVTVTDGCGNSSNTAYSTRIDNTPPTITDCPGNQTASTVFNTCAGSATIAAPTFTDNCGGPLSYSWAVTGAGRVGGNTGSNTNASGSYNLGASTVTYTVSDGLNTTTCSHTITITDNQTPVVACPLNQITGTDLNQCTATRSYAPTSVTDNCTASPAVSYQLTGATTTVGFVAGTINSVAFNPGVTSVTFRATDASGNLSNCPFTVTVTDNQTPVVSCPANIVTSNDAGLCTKTILGADLDPVTVVENCSYALGYSVTGATTASGINVPGSITFNKGVSTVTWTVNENGGLLASASCSYTVTVNDTELPVVAANGSSTVACPALAVPPTVPTASDNCDGTLTGVLTSTVNTPVVLTCEGTRVYTYTYTDLSSNTNTWTYTYTIEREDFTMPANTGSTVACAALITTPTPPSVNDNCGGAITPSGPTVSSTPTCEGDVTYTWNYADCEGNNHNWVYTYTIERLPFADPADAGSTVACAALAVTPTLPTVTDNCGNALTPSGPVMGGTYVDCEGTITYTYLYTDCEGNNHDWVYTYTIERQDFTMPANTGSTVACAALITTPTPPSVNDNCGGAIIPTGPTISSTPACEGDVTYTWNYADCEGNNHDWVYTYTIERLPFADPADAGSTVACAALALTPALPTVVSNCGETLTPTGPVMGGTYVDCEGTITYTYLYTDCEGNTNNWVYTYTIERQDFTMPANTGSTVACAALITTPTPPSVNDNCGGAITPTGPTISSTPACEGDVTYTWNYADCEGNNHDWVYTYTIERLPFADPADAGSTVACAALAVTPTLPNVTDNCGIALTPSGPVMGGTYAGCEGTITFTYLYTDCEGNTNDWVYTYTIDHTTAPAEIGGPVATASTVQCQVDAVAPTLPVIKDICGTTLTPAAPTVTPVINPLTGEGTVSYSYVYTDCSGLQFTWTYVYTVDDTQAPVITVCAPAQNVNLNATCGLQVPNLVPAVTATDNCSTPTVTQSPAANSILASSHNQTHSVTITATDLSGLTTTCTVILTGKDVTNPMISAGTINAVYPTVGQAQSAALAASTASDNCTYAMTAATVGTCNAVVTVTATDAAGNSASVSYSTAIDNQAPVITVCPGNQVSATLPNLCYATVSHGEHLVQLHGDGRHDRGQHARQRQRQLQRRREHGDLHGDRRP